MFENLLATLGWSSGPGARPGSGSSQQPEGAAACEEERRVWVRYPCRLQVSCQPAETVDSETLSARVMNVSRGGIGLLVEREFETGSFLSVDLPAASGEGASRVLAYVLHVIAQPDGRWAVGCSFGIELSDDDLRSFGARRLKPKTGDDQRSWVRFSCPVRASYQVVREAESAQRPAQVVDLSPVGIGLQVSQALDVGTLLSVEMRGAGEAAPLTILASVVRVTARPDGQSTLGCSFIRELSEQELRALL